MKKTKPFLNQKLLTTIYNYIVEPQFSYCSGVWDSIDKTLADKLLKLQNRAASIITDAPYTVHKCNVLASLK